MGAFYPAVPPAGENICDRNLPHLSLAIHNLCPQVVATDVAQESEWPFGLGLQLARNPLLNPYGVPGFEVVPQVLPC